MKLAQGRGVPLNNSRPVDLDDGNAGFEYVTEEEYQSWITDFDQTIGYLGERDPSNSNSALDFLPLFLGDEFWNLLVTETDTPTNFSPPTPRT